MFDYSLLVHWSMRSLELKEKPFTPPILLMGQILIALHVSNLTIAVLARPFKTVVIQPFNHSQEGDLIKTAKNISEAELWITGKRRVLRHCRMSRL